MNLTRRALVGGMAAAGLVSVAPRIGAAQEATPVAGDDASAPGYATIRIRLLEPDLKMAVFPHVMNVFLTSMQAVPGYRGYLYAFHDTDPEASILMTFMDDEAAADATDAAGQEFVSGLDPRIVPETAFSARGPVRIYQPTSRPASELPPFLYNCVITMRERQNAPGIDIDEYLSRLTNDFVPVLSEMPGFVLYAWVATENGRIGINIWETAEQLEAGDEAVAAWVAENGADSTTGDAVVNSGPIAYAELPGLR